MINGITVNSYVHRKNQLRVQTTNHDLILTMGINQIHLGRIFYFVR